MGSFSTSTDRRRAEEALRESEERLSSVIDTASDGIVVVDGGGKIQSANRATSSIFGYTAEELIGQRLSILMPAPLKAFSETGAVKEIEAQRKSGEKVPVDVAVTDWRDSEGRRFFTAILRDITERKRNEEALASARRLEAVGQLAGGVAHDFNNLLHVISGNIEIAQDRVGDGFARELLQRARNAAEKGSAMNRRLLSLARKRALKPEPLALNDRVEETSKLLASTVGEHTTVRRTSPPACGPRWRTRARSTARS